MKKMKVKNVILSGLLFLLICLTQNLFGEIINESITYDGLVRKFITYVPTNYSKNASLIFAFHGVGGKAENFMNLLKLNEKAEANGNVIMVYPQGFGNTDERTSWNAYHCCADAFGSNVDDIGFVNFLIDYLIVKYLVNQNKIYAMGFSNGGMFCHRLGAELANRIAAIADVSGCIGGRPNKNSPFIYPPTPSESISVLMMHGKIDTEVPFADDGTDPRERKDLPFSAGVQFWQNSGGYFNLVFEEVIKVIKNNVIIKLGDHRIYGPENPSDVKPRVLETYTLDNAGHEWPTLNNNDFDASAIIWEFFLKYPKEIDLPDVIINSITWEPTNPIPGQKTTISANIKNQGLAATPDGIDVGVAFEVDGNSLGSFFVRDASLNLKPLAVDESYTGKCSVQWTAAVGTHNISAIADRVNRFPESNENNNVKSRTVTIANVLPDVVIMNISLVPAAPTRGQKVTFYATIKNQGLAATPDGIDVGVAFELDGNSLGSFFVRDANLNLKPLKVNESYTGKCNVQWTAVAGKHNISAIADRVNRFTESNENNNVRTITIVIK